MTAYTVLQSTDNFVEAGPFPVALNSHVNSDGNGWLNIQAFNINHLDVTASGRVQPATSLAPLAVSRVLIGAGFIPSGIRMDMPKFLVKYNVRMAIGASREKILAGLYFKEFASAILAGKTTTNTGLESGDSAIDRNGLCIYSAEFGGGYPRFPAQAPHHGMDLLAGGSSLIQGINSEILFDTVSIYFDEYQVIARWEGMGTLLPITVVAYPHKILGFKPYVELDDLGDPNSLVGISPVLAMATDDISSTGCRITQIQWTYYEHNIREARPDWSPYGALFYAKIPLDFMGFSTSPQLDISTADIGPYIVHPPTMYRESTVLCRMLHLNNTKNGAYVDVSLSTDLTFSVPPGAYLSLALPSIDTQIRVVGGGNRATLLLFSQVVDHQLKI